MFGMMPAYGFFIRHATGIDLNNVEVGYMKEDRRPAFVLDQVKGVEFQHVKARQADGRSASGAAERGGFHDARQHGNHGRACGAGGTQGNVALPRASIRYPL